MHAAAEGCGGRCAWFGFGRAWIWGWFRHATAPREGGGDTISSNIYRRSLSKRPQRTSQSQKEEAEEALPVAKVVAEMGAGVLSVVTVEIKGRWFQLEVLARHGEALVGFRDTSNGTISFCFSPPEIDNTPTSISTATTTSATGRASPATFSLTQRSDGVSSMESCGVCTMTWCWLSGLSCALFCSVFEGGLRDMLDDMLLAAEIVVRFVVQYPCGESCGVCSTTCCSLQGLLFGLFFSTFEGELRCMLDDMHAAGSQGYCVPCASCVRNPPETFFFFCFRYGRGGPNSFWPSSCKRG